MLQKRFDYINDVNKYINNSRSLLNEILGTLGWNKNKVLSNGAKDEIRVCPYDSGHRIPEKSFEKHVASCSLHQDGYTKEDVFLPPAPEPASNVVVIDASTQESILRKSTCEPDKNESGIRTGKRSVPQTSDRLFSDLTASERCAIYDYVINVTTKNSQATEKDVNLPFNKLQDSKPKTLEELLAAERNAKRRRVRYRSKKVHTNRKTQTEILREVIQSQMEGYEEWVNQQQGNPLRQNTVVSESLSNVKPTTKEEDSEDKIKKKSNVKEIIRSWDDFSYQYKGNPHKRYITILEEERNINHKNHKRKRSVNEDEDRFNHKKESYKRKRDTNNDEIYFDKVIDSHQHRKKHYRDEYTKNKDDKYYKTDRFNKEKHENHKSNRDYKSKNHESRSSERNQSSEGYQKHKDYEYKRRESKIRDRSESYDKPSSSKYESNHKSGEHKHRHYASKSHGKYENHEDSRTSRKHKHCRKHAKKKKKRRHEKHNHKSKSSSKIYKSDSEDRKSSDSNTSESSS